MNLPQLRDISEITEERTSFIKYRILEIDNIFSCLFITTIERLIIKKCFSYAFEVFFGVLLQVSECQEIEIFEAYKSTIALFTCTMQSKKLTNFVMLQQKESFYQLINKINQLIEYEDCLTTIRIMQEFLKKVRIDVKIHDEIPEYFEWTSRFAINIAILNNRNNYYLLYELCDFMDDEALRIYEQERKIKLAYEKRIKIEEEIKITREIEQQRLKENDFMKIEEIFMISFLKKEIEIQKSEEQIMNIEEFFSINFITTETSLENNNNAAMVKEENAMNEFIYKQKEFKEKEELNRRFREIQQMESEEFLQKQFYLQEQQEKYESDLLQALQVYEYKLNEIELSEKKRILRDLSILTPSSPSFRLSLSIPPCTSPLNLVDCSPILLNRTNSLTELQEAAVDPDSLLQESQLLSLLAITCGSLFCSKCHRMLKRSSLFLKCSGCCDTAFLQALPKSSNVRGVEIPYGSQCSCCSEVIVRGEAVRCICCYIRNEFFGDSSEGGCAGCRSLEENSWVDICIGKKNQVVYCGVCERYVNYWYMIEVCMRCKERICLFCLRENPLIALSLCSGCKSRRGLNPINKRGRTHLFKV